MSWTDPTAFTDALFAQWSLTRRAVRVASPAVFSVEAPATAALGVWFGHPPAPVREHIPYLIAVGVKVGERLLARPRDRHPHLSRRQRLIAAVAASTDARSPQDPRCAVTRQATVPDLAVDEEAERFLVDHRGPNRFTLRSSRR